MENKTMGKRNRKKVNVALENVNRVFTKSMHSLEKILLP